MLKYTKKKLSHRPVVNSILSFPVCGGICPDFQGTETSFIFLLPQFLGHFASVLGLCPVQSLHHHSHCSRSFFVLITDGIEKQEEEKKEGEEEEQEEGNISWETTIFRKNKIISQKKKKTTKRVTQPQYLNLHTPILLVNLNGSGHCCSVCTLHTVAVSVVFHLWAMCEG